MKLTQNIPLSHIFKVMSGLVELNFISSFYATRNTLEQVFISFARFQHDFYGENAQKLNQLPPGAQVPMQQMQAPIIQPTS